MPLDRRKTYRIVGSTLRSKNTFVSDAVVEQVLGHRDLFIANVMRDSEDYRPVRIRYLGVFAMIKNKIKR
jgi:hypothetical protein